MSEFVPGVWIVDIEDGEEFFILSYNRLEDETFELSRNGTFLSRTCGIDYLERWCKVSDRLAGTKEKEAAAKLL